MTKTLTKSHAKKRAPKPKSSTALVVQPAKLVSLPKQLAQSPAPIGRAQRVRDEFTDEQLELIKQTVAKGTTDQELSWFLTVAKKTELNPLLKQIHCVKRWNAKLGREEMTIQTGIDGFRAIANRSGCYAPSDKKPEVIYDSHGRLFSITFWIKKFLPIDRSWHEYSATVLWDEFVPTVTVDGTRQIAFMWAKMPYNQLEKCAEAKALRRGFPELEGLYVHEELARADVEATPSGGGGESEPGKITRESLQAQKRERERATLEPGKEENRGHGNEGYVDQGPKPGTRAVSPDEKKKEQKEEARQEKLETLDTKVEKVDPKMKKLTPEQLNENKKAKAQGKPETHQPQPYFIVTCSGQISVFAWDKHLFRAVIASTNKPVVWKIERRKSETKEYLSLAEIVSQDGVSFVVDPESKDWVPVTALKSEAPAVPDSGESVPRPVNKAAGQDESMFS